VSNSRVVISDTLFTANGNDASVDYALYATGAGSVISVTGSAIRNNTARGLYAGGSARVAVHNSQLCSNGGYQAVQSGAIPLDARFNWWGQAAPSAGFFSGNMIYNPWIGTSAYAAGYFDLSQDAYEPNEAFTTALALPGVNTSLAAFLDPYGDANVYSVTVNDVGPHSRAPLLAVADAGGAAVALQVRLYAADQSLLATAAGAAGGVITASASISPGLYYVQVTGAGSVPMSHLPYRLTVLLADPRSNLVRDTRVAGAGRTYDFGSFAINLAAGASTQITATAPPSLTVPGAYYLRGKVSNSRDQVLANSLYPFFLSENPLAVMLNTDRDAYRPNQAVAVSGQVHNTGDDPIGPETLTLARDGVTFHTESISLAGHGVQDFAANTTALPAAGQFTLTAQISTTQVLLVRPVLVPEVDLTLDAPDVVLPQPFVAQLQVANNRQVPAAVVVDFHGQAHAATLQPGELVVYSRTLTFAATTDLTVQITGDVTETVTHTVQVSAAPDLTLSPDLLQHEGDVAIPYQLTNPGAADLVAQVAFELADAEPFAAQAAGVRNQESGIRSQGNDLPTLRRQGVAWLPPTEYAVRTTQHATRDTSSAISYQPSAIVITRTHTLPAGSVVSDTLVAALTRGVQPVAATLRVDKTHNLSLFSHSVADAWQETEAITLTVRGDNDLQLTASGAPTVTVVITNVGWNAFTGTLRAVGQREEVFSSLEQGIAIPTESTRTYTATVDTSGLASGPYTVTLQVWAENGVLVRSTALTGTVPAPDFVVTQVPTQTTLFSDQVVTLIFGVENRGQAPDTASFHFTLGDLKDETQKQWMAAGATALFTYTTYLPLDMPTMDVLASYAVTSTLDPAGDAGRVLFHVEGISLTVQAQTDQPYYLEGDPFTVILTITNAGSRDTGELTALTAFNGIAQTQAFNLTPGAQVAPTFSYTATFLADRKIFYGIYGQQSDRGAYLNTLYLYRQNLGVTLQLDKQVYLPGGTAQATLVTTLTQGALNAFAFDQTHTLTIGSDIGFSFTVPADAERGSHALYYVVHGCDCFADGREQTTWFDVAAPWVRVIESHLREGPYLPGQAVSATLTVAADAAQDVEVHDWILYRNGSQGQTYRQTVSLAASLDNQVVITAVITDTQMGLHQLLYRLVPVVQLARLRAAQVAQEEGTPQAHGSESFDVGPAVFQRLATDQAAYPNLGDPVVAQLDIYSAAGGLAYLTLTPDAGPVTVRTLNLAAGQQTVQVTLDGPLPAGERTLTAQLTMAGYQATQGTRFAYGTSLPDLRPTAAWLAGGSTPELAALVFNEGQGAAGASSVAFYLGPADSGVLIGTAAVPALAAGADAAVTVAWPGGGAGDHLITVRADATAAVTEYDETDNDAAGTVTIAPAVPPAVAPTVAVARDAGDVLITWTHNAANAGGYQVWYSSDFYFTPGSDCSAPPAGMTCVWLPAPTASHRHTGAAADVAHNYAYQVFGLNGLGQRSAVSNRVAEFGFGLTPGAP